MKTLKISLIVIAALALIGGAGYLYAASNAKSKSGYAKLVTPSAESVNTLLSVKIGRGGLGPVRWLLEQIADGSEHQNPMPKRVFKSVLQDIQGVQLRLYEVNSNRHVFDEAIADSVALLEDKSWQTLVTVREGDERIVVMQNVDGQKITGLSIMASTVDTALFVNLIGPFDLDAMAETIRKNRGA